MSAAAADGSLRTAMRLAIARTSASPASGRSGVVVGDGVGTGASVGLVDGMAVGVDSDAEPARTPPGAAGHHERKEAENRNDYGHAARHEKQPRRPRLREDRGERWRDHGKRKASRTAGTTSVA